MQLQSKLLIKSGHKKVSARRAARIKNSPDLKKTCNKSTEKLFREENLLGKIHLLHDWLHSVINRFHKFIFPSPEGSSGWSQYIGSGGGYQLSGNLLWNQAATEFIAWIGVIRKLAGTRRAFTERFQRENQLGRSDFMSHWSRFRRKIYFSAASFL